MQVAHHDKELLSLNKSSFNHWTSLASAKRDWSPVITDVWPAFIYAVFFWISSIAWCIMAKVLACSQKTGSKAGTAFGEIWSYACDDRYADLQKIYIYFITKVSPRICFFLRFNWTLIILNNKRTKQFYHFYLMYDQELFGALSSIHISSIDSHQ